jgi:glycosyltransferase involved in cell wall biosynthesis
MHDVARCEELFQEHLVAGTHIPQYPQLKLGFPAKNKLLSLWKRHRPDIVHIATEGPLGWSALQAAKRLNIPTISSFHTNFHQYSTLYGLGMLTPIIQNYLRYFHNKTLTTLAPTEKLCVELAAQGYANLSIMARGIDTELFHPNKRCLELRARWGVNQKELVVLYVGRLAKEKNITLVIQAFQKMKSDIPSAKLVFVGEGPLEKELKLACPEAIFTGNQHGESLAKHYASGDLFLFPSITETYGNVVPEALASGLAVVAFDAAAAAQLITHGTNGTLITLKDEAAFIDGAQRLAKDKSLMSKYRKSAHEHIQQRSWPSVGRALEQTLYRIVKQHSQGQKTEAQPSTLRRQICT